MAEIERMTAPRGNGVASIAVASLICLGLGLFWGISYTHYSNTLADTGYTTFLEVAVRGLFCVVFASIVYKRDRLPPFLVVATFVLFAVWYAMRVDLMGHGSVATALFESVAYSVVMAFFLVWYAAMLFRLPSRVLGVVVPVGFAISYAYGVAVVWGECRREANLVSWFVLASIAVGVSFAAGRIKPRNLDGERGPSASVDLNGITGEHGSRFDVPFVGALILFLVLIGMWLRLGADEAGSMWLLRMPVGLACAAVSLASVPLLSRMQGRAFMRWYPAVSFFVLLGALLISVLLWDRAFVIAQWFAGVWLVTFQIVGYVLCGTMANYRERVLSIGIVQGAALVLLAVGNLIEPFFFQAGLHDRSSLVSASFVFVFALALFVGLDVRTLLKKGVAERGTLSTEEHLPAADDAGHWNEALGRLCVRYGISPQERRVLESYSRGRSTAYIAKELVLSEGTVRTYLKRAYAKMDVHGKQELLDAIELEAQGARATG